MTLACIYPAQTKQWIGDLKMNGKVCAVAFTPDSQHLLSTGSEHSFSPLKHTQHTHMYTCTQLMAKYLYGICRLGIASTPSLMRVVSQGPL